MGADSAAGHLGIGWNRGGIRKAPATLRSDKVKVRGLRQARGSGSRLMRDLSCKVN
jgi:hypothetical protein